MIDEQVNELERNVASFERAVAALTADRFVGPLGKWTPRDVVAHLIGWNRYVIRGSRQILKGELPFYDHDPGESFSNVNAELVQMYSSTNRTGLLAELRESKAELVSFLRSLDEKSWAHDFGVRNAGEVITVKSTVEDLVADYAHHRDQLVALVR